MTVVDISGTKISRRIAHALASEMMTRDSMRWVDVRIASDHMDVDRMGELILVVEEVSAERSGLLHWTTHHRVHLGYTPQYGWNDLQEVLGPVIVDWTVKGEMLCVALPTGAAGAVAGAVAGALDLSEVLDDVDEDWDAVPPPPAHLIPEKFHGPNESLIAKVTGLEAKPVLRGIRAGTRAETLWRYEGADVDERMRAAAEAMGSLEWKRHAQGSVGMREGLRREVFQLGTESAEWTYENGRPKMLQQEWWSSHSLPDGTMSEREHHIEGPESLPVVWVHYWNEMDTETLRIQWAAAKEEDASLASAFEANLSRSQRQALGLAVAEEGDE